MDETFDAGFNPAVMDKGLTFPMPRYFAVGEGVRVGALVAFLADLGERRLEFGIGGDSRVLELAQAVVRDHMEVAIRNDLFEGTAAVVGFGVLGVGEPAKEVFRTVVERILDEVMADTEVGLAFAIGENGSLSVEDFAHDDMACPIAFTTINRRCSISSTFGCSASCR